jgi:hypothetical protein
MCTPSTCARPPVCPFLPGYPCANPFYPYASKFSSPNHSKFLATPLSPRCVCLLVHIRASFPSSFTPGSSTLSFPPPVHALCSYVPKFPFLNRSKFLNTSLPPTCAHTFACMHPNSHSPSLPVDAHLYMLPPSLLTYISPLPVCTQVSLPKSFQVLITPLPPTHPYATPTRTCPLVCIPPSFPSQSIPGSSPLSFLPHVHSPLLVCTQVFLPKSFKVPHTRRKPFPY